MLCVCISHIRNIIDLTHSNYLLLRQAISWPLPKMVALIDFKCCYKNSSFERDSLTGGLPSTLLFLKSRTLSHVIVNSISIGSFFRRNQLAGICT